MAEKGRIRVSPELRKFFQKIGRRGGKVGGRKAALNMTPEQRQARARKAGLARWAKERKS